MNYIRQCKDEGASYQKLKSLLHLTLIVQLLREKEIANKPQKSSNHYLLNVK